MVENRKNITKLKIKHRNGAIARPSAHTFSPSKGWRKHFLPEFYPNTGCSRNTMDTSLLFVLFFQPCNKQAGTLQKKAFQLVHIAHTAVIIINRTIPNINTNSQIYYKERKEDLEIFLYGSPVNRYIDYHVLSFFFRKNGACYRLLPTLGYNA